MADVNILQDVLFHEEDGEDIDASEIVTSYNVEVEEKNDEKSGRPIQSKLAFRKKKSKPAAHRVKYELNLNYRSILQYGNGFFSFLNSDIDDPPSAIISWEKTNSNGLYFYFLLWLIFYRDFWLVRKVYRPLSYTSLPRKRIGSLFFVGIL